MPNTPARRILHVDCDMFFVQVAKLEDPEGVGAESLVLVGGRPGERGVVASASYEARAMGVRSAMPMSQALRLCPRAVVVPVPREACSRKSREVRAVLERFTPVVEAASIDEFYLDLTGTERLYGGESLEATAERMREAVRAETGIAVSVGGGTQRVISKMATGLAKPNGLFIVPAGGEAAFMRRFDLADLPGVGPVLAAELRRRGLVKVSDALGYDRDALRGWLGENRGSWLYDRVRGIDGTPVRPRSPAKSVSHEQTFPQDVDELERLEHHLLLLVGELAADLRRKGLRARTIRVYVRDRDFKDRQLARTPDDAVETERAIYRLARAQLRELWDRRSIGVRLLGVAAASVVPRDQPEQIRLLDTRPAVESERERSLARAADALRSRFGRRSVRPGRALE